MRFDDLRIDACVLGFPILQPANAGHEGVEDSSNDICIAFEQCPGLSRRHLGAQHGCNSASGLGMSSGIVPIANKYGGLGGHMAFKWYRLCVLHCTCGVTLGTRGKHVHMMQKNDLLARMCQTRGRAGIKSRTMQTRVLGSTLKNKSGGTPG